MDVNMDRIRCLRTVIVADHGPGASKDSVSRAEADPGGLKHGGSTRSAQSGTGSFIKSMWTMIAEGAVEYCRIIYDVLPDEHTVQVLASDKVTSRLNSFKKEEQSISQILKGLANVGPPKQFADDEAHLGCSILTGLEDGTASLLESLTNISTDVSGSNHIAGRLIVVTSLSSDKDIKPIVSKVSDIQERFHSQRRFHIELVIVNVSATSEKIFKDKKEVSSVLSVSTMSSKAAQLPLKMSLLARKHFNLRSTSITGIPMKEEQHAGTSANYDVEIIHPAEVHHETYWLCANHESQISSLVVPSGGKKDPLSKNVITLKWCTPKVSTNNDLLQCVGAYRCTPAEVNSRPAACLISFLQQGRTVLLEQPKRSGAKILSHMLSSHGGDVYIHVLATGRSPVEDPPSISEGCGGRVTDYRIGDFGKFMKENRLAPFAAPKSSSAEEIPSNQALSRLERGTRHWPMVISETLVFNMSTQLEPLLGHLVKAKLSDDDVQECKKVIYKLQAMESRNDTLPLPMISMRGKGSKREEQYRQLWAELETFIQEASRTSANHNKVYNCLHGSQESRTSLASASSNNTASTRNKDPRQAEPHSAQDLAWKELDRYSQMTEHEKRIANQAPSDPRKRKMADQNEENKSVKKKAVQSNFPVANVNSLKPSFSAKMDLLSIWTNQRKRVADRFHEEFEGSKNAIEGKTELYAELNKELNIASLNTTSVKEWV